MTEARASMKRFIMLSFVMMIDRLVLNLPGSSSTATGSTRKQSPQSGLSVCLLTTLMSAAICLCLQCLRLYAVAMPPASLALSAPGRCSWGLDDYCNLTTWASVHVLLRV